MLDYPILLLVWFFNWNDSVLYENKECCKWKYSRAKLYLSLFFNESDKKILN